MLMLETPNLQEVHVTLIEVGQHYTVRCEGYDDDGKKLMYNDMCYVDEGTVPGQGNKKIRQVRFCRFPKVLTLSQLVGVRFFGPMKFIDDIVESQEKVLAANPGLADFVKNLGNPA